MGRITHSWGVKHVLSRWLQSALPNRIIEFGCGTGELSTHIHGQHLGIFYLGYDKSPEMIRVANAHYDSPNAAFTSSWAEVEEQTKKQPFDMALVLFTLHDHATPQNTLSQIADCIRPGGIILIVDLSTWDLPRLTDLLRKGLARPLRTFDNRLDPIKLTELAKASNSVILNCEVAVPLVYFPSADSVSEYLEIFGILDGMDLPLGLKHTNTPDYRQLTARILEHQTYPFADQRAFIICTLKKQ